MPSFHRKKFKYISYLRKREQIKEKLSKIEIGVFFVPLVTARQMLLDAQKGGYAVGAFNIENMEMAQAVVVAAQKMYAPVIVQTTPKTVRYAGAAVFSALVSSLAGQAGVPVARHLDHGESVGQCVEALRAGYSSIMIDGSRLTLEENISLTKKVADLCAQANVPVEGELGRVGGKEDDAESAGMIYTDPDEAVRFEAETGVDSLAIGVGTAHGIYAGIPTVNAPLVLQLRNILKIPLVLHGASGIPGEVIKDCIKRGICKVNFATELRVAYTDGVKEALAEKADLFDPKIIGEAAKSRVQTLVEKLIAMCGCAGKV